MYLDPRSNARRLTSLSCQLRRLQCRVFSTFVKHSENAITYDYKRSRVCTTCVVTFRWHILNGTRKGEGLVGLDIRPLATCEKAPCEDMRVLSPFHKDNTYTSEYPIRPNAFVPLLRVINSGPLEDAPSFRDDVSADCGLFSKRTLSAHCICNIDT